MLFQKNLPASDIWTRSIIISPQLFNCNYIVDNDSDISDADNNNTIIIESIRLKFRIVMSSRLSNNQKINEIIPDT